jgi:competence protein ComEC
MSAAAIAPVQAPQLSRERVAARPDANRVEPLAFQAAPALFAACCFAAGTIVSHSLFVTPPLLLLALLLASSVAVVAMRVAMRTVLLPVALAWSIAGFLCAEIYPGPDPQTALLAFASGSVHLIHGEIVREGPVRMIESSAPFAKHEAAEKSQALDLRVAKVTDAQGKSIPVGGGLRLSVFAPVDEQLTPFACGAKLRVTASIHPPERYKDPGVWNSTAYLLGQGIGALASAKVAAVAVEAEPVHASLSCRLRALQQAACERILALAEPVAGSAALEMPSFFQLSAEDASMLAAMITGDRVWLQRRTRVGFERTGSFHLLVVSGLHLAIFAGILFWCAQRAHLPRIWATLITIAAAQAYAIFTGYGQPVQRSFWMVTLYLLARLLWRERSALNAIGFAALCLLAANPSSLFDAGFQMTLLSVIAIAGIAMPLAEGSFAPYLRATRSLALLAIDPALPPRVAQFRVSLRLLGSHLQPIVGRKTAFSLPAIMVRLGLRVIELLLVSITVEMVMSLPMALYFHRITVLALPVNFLIVPFLGLLLPSALLTFATLLLSARLATIPAAVTAALLHCVTRLISAFAGLRAADLRIPGLPILSIVCFIALLGFAICAARLRRFAIPACMVTGALMVAVVVWQRPIERRAGALEITAIDVGQGDSLLVVTPDGKTLLIDAGGSPFGAPPGMANFDIGEEVVSAYLWSRGIRRLDVVALTHAHADHIGGLAAVLANFRPRQVWIGNNPHSEAYEAFLAEAHEIGAVVAQHAAGEHFQFGATQVGVLAPDAGYVPGLTARNNDSLVLRIEYAHTSALLEGDAEAPSEARMIAAGPLHSDLLKIGHHGSRTSTTPPFLKAVSPSWAVISVGSRNLYGHPRREVLEELQSAHIHSYRTDTLGISTFYLDGNGVTAAAMPASQD